MTDCSLYHILSIDRKMVNLANTRGDSKKLLEADLIRTLKELIPSLKITRTRVEQKVEDTQVDLAVEVVTPSGRKRWLWIEIKPAPVPSLVRESFRRLKAGPLKESKGYAMLASNFVTPRVREICREEGAGYIDRAGNCFLQLDDLYVEKVIEKNPYPKPGRPSSLFTPVSSRILRTMLQQPEREWAVRELSEAAQVSLAQTSKIYRRLLEDEYAKKNENRIQLSQPGKLLDAWREQYTVKANTRFAYFSFDREQLIARIATVGKANQWRYALTSFSAASLVAPFIRGVDMTTWYVNDATAIDLWAKALDLRPTDSGPNALLLVPYDSGVFSGAQPVDDVILVGNIQLYLDLYNDPARGREQAEFLRKEKIGF